MAFLFEAWLCSLGTSFCFMWRCLICRARESVVYFLRVHVSFLTIEWKNLYPQKWFWMADTFSQIKTYVICWITGCSKYLLWVKGKLEVTKGQSLEIKKIRKYHQNISGQAIRVALVIFTLIPVVPASFVHTHLCDIYHVYSNSMKMSILNHCAPIYWQLPTGELVSPFGMTATNTLKDTFLQHVTQVLSGLELSFSHYT